MIISKDTNPAKDLYYIGNLILQYFIDNRIKVIGYTELIAALKSEYNISTNLLSLSLDWIYMLGSVEIDDKGDLVICF
jgi:hypothetical protein